MAGWQTAFLLASHLPPQILRHSVPQNDSVEANLPLDEKAHQKEKLLTVWLTACAYLMVGAPGFEPGAPCTPCRCATWLRYAPIKKE